MKGEVWQVWIFGTIAAFIAIMIFYVFSPVFIQVQTSAFTNVNYTSLSTNTSVTNTFNNIKTMWDLWPIGAVGMVFLLFFMVASDDEQKVRRI